MNALADLYAFQADDVLEEWDRVITRSMRECVEDALFEGYGYNIEVAPKTHSDYHYHTTDGVRYRVSGSKEMCIDCQYNLYRTSPDTRISDIDTAYIPHTDEATSLRPAEDSAFERWYWRDDLGQTGRQALTNNTKEQKRIDRSNFVKALDNEHKAWLIQFEADLRDTHTMRGLDDMVSLAKAHDARLSNKAGREFCNTLIALRHVFNDVGNRILYAKAAKHQYEQRKAVATVVHHQPMPAPVSMGIRFPALMVHEKGGKALADNAREMQRYINEGWQCANKS